MGLIKAASGAIGGMMADQWKEFFSCDALSSDVLVARGYKNVSGRSSNTKGESNVISDGSVIVVADGQCAMIVDQGQIVDICAEPGTYTYQTGTTPSIFAGNLKDGLKGAALDAWNRFQFGGGAGKDQRIYYFNTKKIVGNKYGTANPVPFKVTIDQATNRKISIDVRCNGEYAYKIVNPMLFYKELCGNISNTFDRSEIDGQLKSDVLKYLQVALAKVSAKGIDYSEIPLYTVEIGDALNEAMSPKWSAGNGIEIAEFGVNSVFVSEEDKQKIQRLEQASMGAADPMMLAANMAQAQSEAMLTAAGNTSGAMTGFMGMNMAGGMGGGMDIGGILNQGMQMRQQQQQMQMQQQQMQMQQQQMQMQQQQAQTGTDSWTCSCGATATGKFCMECGAKKPEPKPAAAGWTCSCGAVNTGKFCMECGNPKPADEGWTCSCGAVNKGKFCPECGAKKPAAAPLYQCDKCGWKPEDPHNPPKFCPECGDIFDDNDIQ